MSEQYKLASTMEGVSGIVLGERVVLQPSQDEMHSVQVVLHVLETETAPLLARIAELEAALDQIESVAKQNEGSKVSQYNLEIIAKLKAGDNG